MSTFRLATVERLRERQLQVCVQALHIAAANLAQAQQTRASLVERLHQGTPRGTVASPQLLLLESMYRERLRGDIIFGDEEIEQLTAVVGERRAEWLTAHAALRAIQALHERHRAGLRATAARRDQRELDELASNRRAIGPGESFEDGETTMVNVDATEVTA
jgi:flagellar export protein FliJ